MVNPLAEAKYGEFEARMGGNCLRFPKKGDCLLGASEDRAALEEEVLHTEA